MLGRFIRWIGNGRAAGKLRRRARQTADANARADLLLAAVQLDDDASTRLEAAAALAEAGRHEESAESWRRAAQLHPLTIPNEAQLAALAPVMERIAPDVLAGLTSRDRKLLGQHWTLERRGNFDGEERWRLEQENQWELKDLEPVLRYIALAVAHTGDAPGRLRIDCDRFENDAELYNPIKQMGEAIIAWDAERRITGVRLKG